MTARKRANQGSQGGIVAGRDINASAIAVGRGAKASYTSGSMDLERLDSSLRRLAEAIHAQPLSKDQHEHFSAQLQKLRAQSKAGAVNKDSVGTFLSELSSKLRSVGVVVADTIALRKPIEDLIEVLGPGLSKVFGS